MFPFNTMPVDVVPSALDTVMVPLCEGILVGLVLGAAVMAVMTTIERLLARRTDPKAAGTRPATAQKIAAQPSTAQPTAAQPTVARPAAARPAGARRPAPRPTLGARALPTRPRRPAAHRTLVAKLT
jgi:hypothetical protein